MIRSWILYILTVGVVFVFTILYGKQSGFLLCLLTVLLPLIYAALTIILASRMGIRLRLDGARCQKENTRCWMLEFQDGSVLIQGNRLSICYKICTAQGKICDRKKQIVFLENDKEYEMTYQTKYAGKYTICIERITIYSGFSLFYKNLVKDLSDSFFIMPKYREELVQIEPLPAQREGDGDTFIQGKEGNDPSELLGFREYRPGDKRNRIDWRATIKTGELMVPQYGFPVACDVGIFVDLEQVDDKKTERVLELVYALCIAIKEQGRNWYVTWENRKSERLERNELKWEFDIHATLYRLAGSIGEHSVKLEDLYTRRFEDACFSRVYFISDRKKQGNAEEAVEKLCAEKVVWMDV